MDKEVKELLNQVLANQAVIYKMLRQILEPSKKSTPNDWILEELEEKAKEFKIGL